MIGSLSSTSPTGSVTDPQSSASTTTSTTSIGQWDLLTTIPDGTVAEITDPTLVPSEANLRLPEGVRMEIKTNGILRIDGNLTVEGVLVLSGTLTVPGTVTIASGGELESIPASTIVIEKGNGSRRLELLEDGARVLQTKNEGSIKVEGIMRVGGTLMNKGILAVLGTMENKEQSSLTNEGEISVAGSLENALGTIENRGTIQVEENGRFTAGKMTNAAEGSIDVEGSMLVWSDGRESSLRNDGNISISGSMDNLNGKIANKGSIKVESTGSLTAGEMTNAEGAEVEVNGMLRTTVANALKNDGKIVVNTAGGGRVEG